jgi:hypothetical protein
LYLWSTLPDKRPCSLLQVVAFLTGIVETHGLDGVAVLFGVSEIPFPSSLSKQLEELGGHLNRKEFKQEGEGASLSAASSSSRSNTRGGGEGEGEGTSRISSSALHCLCLCWMMATRALNQFPRSLPPKGLLMVQLAEAVGRLLDTMAGLMTPQQWGYLVSLGGTSDAQMISRQMSLDGLHPVLLRHCKDNPLYYL